MPSMISRAAIAAGYFQHIGKLPLDALCLSSTTGRALSHDMVAGQIDHFSPLHNIGRTVTCHFILPSLRLHLHTQSSVTTADVERHDTPVMPTIEYFQPSRVQARREARPIAPKSTTSPRYDSPRFHKRTPTEPRSTYRRAVGWSLAGNVPHHVTKFLQMRDRCKASRLKARPPTKCREARHTPRYFVAHFITAALTSPRETAPGHPSLIDVIAAMMPFLDASIVVMQFLTRGDDVDDYRLIK